MNTALTEFRTGPVNRLSERPNIAALLSGSDYGSKYGDENGNTPKSQSQYKTMLSPQNGPGEIITF